MSELLNIPREEHLSRAEALVASLPPPDYGLNLQVPYNQAELVEAVAINLSTTGVAQPEEIEDLSREIAAVGDGSSDRPIVITNSCAEEILPMDTSVAVLGDRAFDELLMVKHDTRLVDPIAIQRICGQFVKPRSKMTEVIDGHEVMSYMGDGINGSASTERMPDASRLVAGALQARDLQEDLTAATGSPVLVAHEALSLPYELPFVRQDSQSGRTYLESAHLPWVGVRTNAADGVHVELLAGVENTVGVKIGSNTDNQHVKRLVEKLNPSGDPGRIAFMMRLAAKDEHLQPGILRAIKNHAPDSVVLYDIHGATRTRADGKKIRMRHTILESIERLARDCGKAGLRLNGLHLETMRTHGRFECQNHEGQPLMSGNVDPRLNPRQTRYIIDKAAPYINQ